MKRFLLVALILLHSTSHTVLGQDPDPEREEPFQNDDLSESVDFGELADILRMARSDPSARDKLKRELPAYIEEAKRRPERSFRKWLKDCEALMREQDWEINREWIYEALYVSGISRGAMRTVLAPWKPEERRISEDLYQEVRWILGKGFNPIFYRDTFDSLDFIEPDKETQETLEELVRQKTQVERSRFRSFFKVFSRRVPDDAEPLKAMLRRSSESQERFVKQWIYCVSKRTGKEEKNAERAALYEIMDEMEISMTAKLTALRSLMGSTDWRTVDALSDILWIVDDPDRRGVHDERIHRRNLSFRRKRGKPPLFAIMDYLCRVRPDRALGIFYSNIFVDVESLESPDMEFYRRFQIAQREIGNYVDAKGDRDFTPDDLGIDSESVVPSVEYLLRADVWFSRFYAATILRLHPELATEEMILAIRDDSHAWVKKTLRTSEEQN